MCMWLRVRTLMNSHSTQGEVPTFVESTVSIVTRLGTPSVREIGKRTEEWSSPLEKGPQIRTSILIGPK
jgi:hypothetical protein